MTVARLRAEIGNDEYINWSVYFARKAQRKELEHKRQAGGGHG